MHQKQVWDSLAESWSHHRNKPLREVIEFLEKESLNAFGASKQSNIILDIGCGAGRNFVQGKDYIAVDISANMIMHAEKTAQRKKINMSGLVADAIALPFIENSFDTIVCLAVLHCIEKDRQRALDEMHRIMKKGGRALVMVWNKRQPKFWFFKQQIYEPWKTGDNTYLRYYHLFTKNELKSLLENAGFKIISIKGSSNKAFKLFSKNIVAVIEKS